MNHLFTRHAWPLLILSRSNCGQKQAPLEVLLAAAKAESRTISGLSALYRSGVGGPISVRRLKPHFSTTTGHRTTGAVHGEGGVGIVVLVPPDNMLFTLATICNFGGS